jgi:hypothetical protein
MKPATIVGIVLIIIGVVMGVVHFATHSMGLAPAAGVLIGGVAVLCAKCGT